MLFFAMMAFSAGIAIAIQAGFNARLGVLLNNTLLASTIAFVISGIFTFLVVLFTAEHVPTLKEIRYIPGYFWFIGAVFSAFGVTMFYYLIPKMGVGSVLSFSLTGQLIVGMIASHYGWFDLPVKPISVTRMIGVVSMVVGIVLINFE
mgnify:CR=1 FL=1